VKEEFLATTRPKRAPLVRRLLVHLHLVVLGAVVLAAALHLAGVLFAGPRGIPAVNGGIDRRIELLREVLDRTEADLSQEQRQLERLTARVKAVWERLPGEPPEVSADVTYSRNRVAARRRDPPMKNEIRFLPPKEVRVRPEMGRMLVTWLQDADSNVQVSGRVVLRAVGDRPPEEHGRLGADAKSFTDDDVEAGRSYTYRIVALTDEPTLPVEERRSAPSKPVTDRAVADVRLALVDADAEAGTATFNVEKWHEGGWYARRFTASTGEELGAVDPGTGVDYATGWKVRSVTADDVSETKRIEQVTFDRRGHVVLESGRPVFEEVPVTETFREVTVVLESSGRPDETHVHREKT